MCLIFQSLYLSVLIKLVKSLETQQNNWESKVLTTDYYAVILTKNYILLNFNLLKYDNIF